MRGNLVPLKLAVIEEYEGGVLLSGERGDTYSETCEAVVPPFFRCGALVPTFTV